MNKSMRQLYTMFLENTPIVIFVGVFLFIGILAPGFFQYENMLNVVKQSSYIGIIAIGVTLTLLIAGIDISVGSNMYVSGAIAGILMEQMGYPIWVALVVSLLIGLAFGTVNAFAIVELGVNPLIVTLGTLVAGRGLGLMFTKSATVWLPDRLLNLVTIEFFGFIPLPIVFFAIVVACVSLFLRNSTLGRQIYAIGHEEEAAEKAGINIRKLSWLVYLLCGFFAALGGFISMAQAGSVGPSFGEGIEFRAIAAAVLGGTSLFGGRGTVFPGTVLGTVLIEMIGIGMVFIQLDLYLQPLVTATILFLAVWLDSFRIRELERLQARTIRVEEAQA